MKRKIPASVEWMANNGVDIKLAYQIDQFAGNSAGVEEVRRLRGLRHDEITRKRRKRNKRKRRK